MSIISRSLFGGAFLFFFLPLFVFGQTDTDDITTEPSHVVANINLSDARIISQDSERLQLAFLLTNLGDNPQSDIRYGVELIKTLEDGTQVILDTFVSPSAYDLPVGGKLNLPIDVPLSGVPPGDYSVWIKARTTGGVLLGLGSPGTVIVTESEALGIDPGTCSLTIPGLEEVFNLRQGVDIATDEDLLLSCFVTNHASKERAVVPEFMTHRRTVFGELVTISNIDTDPLIFAAGEVREINLLLPKATEPQAYDTVLTFVDALTNEVVSNHLISHYVLQGASATIQNINFSQSNYQAGENIIMELSWTPAADSFIGSRQGEGSEIGEIVATVQISDQSGNFCATPLNQVLLENPVTFNSLATSDCLLPMATVSFANADGEIFDSRTVVAPEEIKNDDADSAMSKTTFLITVVALALALITILLLLLRRPKRIDFIQATKLLVLATVMTSGLFLAGVEKVEAVTWGSGNVSFTASTDKASYLPGEQIQVNVTSEYNACGNYPAGTAVGMDIVFEGVTRSVTGGMQTVNFTAPSPFVETQYTVQLFGKFRIGEDGNWQQFPNSIEITVTVAAPISGNIFANGNSGSFVCTIPIGAFRCDPVTISWSTSNAISPAVRVEGNPSAFGSGVSGAQEAPWIDYGSTYIFNLHNNSNQLPVLDSVTVTSQCVSGSGWNGSSCMAYTCTGTVPNNAGLCSDDNTGLTDNTAISLVNSCSAPKCQYTCDAGYSLVGGVCVENSSPYTCTGVVPNNAGLCNTDDIGLTGNTAISLVNSCSLPEGSNPKCQYTCEEGYSLVNGSCQVTSGASGIILANPNPCTVAIGASTCTSNITWSTNGTNSATDGVWTGSGGLFSSNSSGSNVPSPTVRGGAPGQPGQPDAPLELNLRESQSGATLASVSLTGVCASGSTWDGSVCAAGGVAPAANITAPDCQITVGNSTCISNVSWNSTNVTSPSVRQNGSQFSALPSSVGTERTLSYATHTFNVFDGSTLLATDYASAVCAAGSSWDGSVCVAGGTAPTASINAPDCTIIGGQSSCISSVSWDTENIISPSIRQNNTQFSTLTSSLGTDRTLTRGTHHFTIYDSGVERASDYATAECAPSAPWNGSICNGVPASAPAVTLSASPDTIPDGNSSTLTWRVTGTADSCWASNGWSGWKAFSSNIDHTEPVSPEVTTTYRIICYNQGVASVPAETTVTVTNPPSGSPKLIICPANSVSIPVAGEQQLIALHRDNYTGSQDCGSTGWSNVTSDATWTSPGNYTSLSPNFQKTGSGIVTGDALGTEDVTATYSGESDSKPITVTDGGSGGPYDPDITIVSNPGIVRSGETAEIEITITADFELQCELAGAATDTFTHTGLTDTVIYDEYESVPLTAATVVEVTCTDPDGDPHSDETTISVIPVFQET